MKERRKPPPPAPLPGDFEEAPPRAVRAARNVLRDARTGLYSMAALHEFIRYEIDGGAQTERNERFVTPVCAVAIGIDALPSGASARRKTIVAVTEAVGRITRRSDRMAREGDDLVALLRRTLAKRAREFYAVNTARLVAEATAEAGCPATVSFGIASLTEHLVRSPEDMMEKAFLALAAARRAGPGSVVVHDLRLGS